MPHIPTAPVHHGWAASHSTASNPSRVSSSVYSSSATPADEPVPRTSTRHEDVAAGREPRPRGRRRRCVASCPCRTGSSRGWPGTGPRRRHRSAAGARCWPTARCRHGSGSGRPSRRVTAKRGWLAGRAASASTGVVIGRESTGRRARGDATDRRVRRCRHGRPSRSAHGPWTRRSRRVALREPVAHGLARRGRSGRTASPGSTASSTSRTSRPASSSSTPEDRVAARRAASLHARRVRLGDPGGRRARGRGPARRRPARAPRGDRASTPPIGRSSPASTSPTRSPTRSPSSTWRRS